MAANHQSRAQCSGGRPAPGLPSAPAGRCPESALRTAVTARPVHDLNLRKVEPELREFLLPPQTGPRRGILVNTGTEPAIPPVRA
jgi:hypothetical protein